MVPGGPPAMFAPGCVHFGTPDEELEGRRAITLPIVIRRETQLRIDGEGPYHTDPSTFLRRRKHTDHGHLNPSLKVGQAHPSAPWRSHGPRQESSAACKVSARCAARPAVRGTARRQRRCRSYRSAARHAGSMKFAPSPYRRHFDTIRPLAGGRGRRSGLTGVIRLGFVRLAPILLIQSMRDRHIVR